MGFSYFNAEVISGQSGSSSDFWYDGVDYSGNENNISECNHNELGIEDCNSGEHINIIY